MSISGMSGPGKIQLFTDFCGNEIPVANAEAATTPGHSAGPFSVLGDLVQTDAGLVMVSKSNGWGRLTSSAADTRGAALATEVVFSPVLNGGLVIEARVELAALTARNVFIGFTGTIADNVVECLTATTATITKVYPSLGFLFDSQLTVDATASTAVWHMPYLLAADTTQASTAVASSQVAVAEESDILRLEVDPDGAARWYINGKLEQTVAAGLAATTTTLLGALCGVWGTASTVGSLDVDYLLVEASRDWTR